MYLFFSKRARSGLKETDLKMLSSACGLGQHFQDLGHSFSLYGPPSRQITYRYLYRVIKRERLYGPPSMYSQLIRKQGAFNLFKMSILFFIVSLYPAVTALHQATDSWIMNIDRGTS